MSLYFARDFAKYLVQKPRDLLATWENNLGIEIRDVPPGYWRKLHIFSCIQLLKVDLKSSYIAV